MTRKQLRRAAFHLRDYATVLRDSHCVGDRRWINSTDIPGDGDQAKADHDEMMLLAGELGALARDPSFVPFD